MTTWICSDSDDSVEIEADSRKEAAQKFVETGDWEPEEKTYWVKVDVAFAGNNYESIKVPVHPKEPKCSEWEHEWHRPYEILGGCKENPGVWGSGGGTVSHDLCQHCGVLKVENNWAQDPIDGEQGLRSIQYR